jgi:Flp pilus assembly protein TadG
MTKANETGAAAVEFALVMPVFFLIVFGIIDFGRAYFTTSSLTHAAREGVRVVALGGSADEAEARTVDAAAGLSDVDASVEDSGAAVDGTWTCSFGNPTDVVATVPFEYVTPLGGFVNLLNPVTEGFDGPSTLTSRASMRCGG